MRLSQQPVMIAVVAAMAVAALPSAALADAIDGTWCSADGHHLSISGPSIVTPGGAHVIGDYSRHAFSYTAPNGETGAGSVVTMRLIDEDDVRIFLPSAMPAVWQRCRAETS